MQRSVQDVCPSGHVEHRWTLGVQDRGLDQGELGDGEHDADVTNYGDEYKTCKSSKPLDCGNDSGFVETLHTIDTDDTSAWRKDFIPAGVLLAAPNICSTPIREPSFYFQRIDITRSGAAIQRSPINHEHVSPVLSRETPHTTVGYLPLGISVCPPSRTPNSLERMPYNDADIEMIAERNRTYGDNYAASQLSRGHRTIASMLKSRPLNMTSPKQNMSPAKQNYHFECLSDLPRVALNTDSNKPNAIAEHTETNTSSVQGVCHVETYRFPRYCKQRLFATGDQYSDISDGDETGGVDENNNVNEITPKYSDISDACVSDAGSLVETSSSEEEVAINNIAVTKPRLSVVKRGRKLSIPQRSPSKEDPKFRGVTVWLQTSFQNGTSGLQMSAFYSNVNARPMVRRKSKTKNRWSSGQGRWCSSRCWSCSDQEDGVTTQYPRDNSIVKTCASCKTRRTPLWRDAEDGTPLCNACGIRYKKYRLRCSKCWHIPKKEVKTYPNCPACGGPLRYSSHKKSW